MLTTIRLFCYLFHEICDDFKKSDKQHILNNEKTQLQRRTMYFTAGSF